MFMIQVDRIRFEMKFVKKSGCVRYET
jgi:hypothetical protein